MTRIVIVEDEPTERVTLRTLVETWPGCTCVGAYGTAESLLHNLPATRPHVAIVDLGLPRMSGIRCVWKLKEHDPNIVALVHTVESRSAQVFQAIQAGATGYLLKGVPVTDLRRAVTDLLAGGSVMTPSIARHVLRWFQRPPPLPADAPPLSAREQQVLTLLTRGFRNDEIATELGMTVNTVKTHVRRIYDALHVHSRGELFARLHPG